MTARQLRALVMGVGTALAGFAVAPLFVAGNHNARAAGLPLLSSQGAALITVSVPGITVPVPGISTSLPSVTVSLPGVEASLPSVSVSPPTTTSSSGTPPPISETPTAPSSGNTPTSPGTQTTPSTPTAPTAGAPEAPSAAPASTTSSPTNTAIDSAIHRSPTAGAAIPPSSSLRGHTAPRPHPRSSVSSTPAVVLALASADSSSSNAAKPHAAPFARTRPPTTTHTSGNVLDTIGRHIPLPIPVPDWSKPIILALLLLALWLGVRSRVSALRARRLEGQRATLLQDVGVMQSALVPDVPERIGGLLTSVAYRPADGPAAGGDFYDLFVTEPGKVAIILGDVAGHGRQSLNQAALTRYTLRAYLQAGLEPRAALALAGRVLAHPAAENFATVVVGVYDECDGTLVYASAGHPPPLLNGAGAREPLEICCSPPLGWDVPTGRRQSTVSLPASSVVCFFSDGLIEARSGAELLGRERLSEILTELRHRPSAADLLDRVTAETLTTPDDMAACILLPSKACIGYIHVEVLEVDSSALDGIEVRRFLKACEVPTHEIAHTIARARDVAAEFGTAVLRIDLGHSGASTTVSEPVEQDELHLASSHITT
jgi:hypothetical protein